MSMNTFWEEMNHENTKLISECQVITIVWWGKWDEWKWWDAYNLALNWEYEMILSVIWWPNAWHTAIRDDWKKFVWHNLPWAALTWKEVFLWQGKYINIEWLNEEVMNLINLWIKPNIKIAYWAHCLFPSFHWWLDGAIETAKWKNWNAVGTTLSGMWPWVASRWLRNSIPIWKLQKLSKSDIKICVKELTEPFNPDFIPNKEEIEPEIIEHQFILKDLIDSWIVEIVEDDFATNMYQDWVQLIIEWAQSPSLWMYGWSYPYNTSTDTSFLGILSSAWIVPEIWRVWEILVVKVFPSAVWNHEFQERVSHVYPELLSKEMQFWAATGEYWATTKRARMVGLPSPALVAEYIRKDPYVKAVSLRKLDVLTQFQKIVWLSKLPVVAWYNQNWKPIISQVNYNPKELVSIYRNIIDDVVWDNKWTNLPFILWFGPRPKDSRILNP